MKIEYLKTADVAEELRCSLSKARLLMKDEMTCLAIGTGIYRTRVVERAELERWKQRQIEPPMSEAIAPPRKKRAVKTMSFLPPDIPLDSRGWPLPPHGIAWERAMAKRRQQGKQHDEQAAIQERKEFAK